MSALVPVGGCFVAQRVPRNVDLSSGAVVGPKVGNRTKKDETPERIRGFHLMWSDGASIPGPNAFQASALPTELSDHAPQNAHKGRHTEAVPTGLEPATSGLTGRRANQLRYETMTTITYW